MKRKRSKNQQQGASGAIYKAQKAPEANSFNWNIPKNSSYFEKCRNHFEALRSWSPPYSEHYGCSAREQSKLYFGLVFQRKSMMRLQAPTQKKNRS